MKENVAIFKHPKPSLYKIYVTLLYDLCHEKLLTFLGPLYLNAPQGI